VRTLPGLDGTLGRITLATALLSWMRTLAEEANRAMLWRTFGSIVEIERATARADSRDPGHTRNT
jgi:hypothetical protein